MAREKLFTLTAADFRWDYYNGSGKGGQNRNKRSNCVRCFHEPSGAMGKCEDERSQAQNKVLAFKRCVETPEFKAWHRLECARRLGALQKAQENADRHLLNTRVE